MRLTELEQAIKDSWNKDTCHPAYADKWTYENPALGQCAVTALVVQDYFGGYILNNEEYHHYWNKIKGKNVDLTRVQFPENLEIKADRAVMRNSILKGMAAIQARTLQRYELLKQRVKDKIKNNYSLMLL